jgi:acetyltransferase-like isoleucine patch superfamily enzyme
MTFAENRTLSWDWHPGRVPENVVVDDTAYIETTYSFLLFRSRDPAAVVYGRGAATYRGTMFDLGPSGKVRLGDYVLVHGARITCDDRIEIGDYCLISWNVLLMDSRRLPLDRERRREELGRVPFRQERVLECEASPRPIRVESNVWIGFGVCVLPGVTIGEGSIIGAHSVVDSDIPRYCVAAGNPARVIKTLDPKAKE